ncbi:hypothetical protein FRB99_006393 [Tulasnella sp. 403]|nr:hypothetical protein FRB99_006393 [Tulasnella sp. 403]
MSGQPIRWMCPVCNFDVSDNPDLWSRHVASAYHTGRAAQAGSPSLNGPTLRQGGVQPTAGRRTQQHTLTSFAPAPPPPQPTTSSRWRRRRAPRARHIVHNGERLNFTTVPFIYELPEFLLDYSFLVAGNETQRRDKIRTMMPNALSASTYADFWASLIHVEEHQIVQDLAIYDLFGVSLRASDAGGKVYFLTVPGLAEKRPSVLWGDSVMFRIEGNEKPWYEGLVVELRLREIGVRFKRTVKINTKNRFDVQFMPCRIPIRRMHEAVGHEFTPERLFFPEGEQILNPLPPSTEQIAEIANSLSNPLVATNPPQLQAVTAIINQPPGSPPFIIYGPAGTGKTVTIIEAARRIYQRDPNSRLFICAPSNSAADLITRRLADFGPDVLFRLNASSLPVRTVAADILPFTFIDHRNQFSVKSREVLEQKRIIVSTCYSASVPYGIGVAPGHFTHIFIDEAGQGTEPEVVISIKTMGNKHTNVIMAGDPKQLGPIVRSRIATELGLGRDEQEERSPSHFNDAEVDLIIEYIERLLSDSRHPLSADDIGVISPYRSQTQKLRKRLRDRPQLKVGSVEEFQGQERMVILITTVRSNLENITHDRRFTLGFLTSERRVNVALTRARAMLIVVGNPQLLGVDNLWKSFISYVHRNSGCQGAQPDWDTSQVPLQPFEALSGGADAEVTLPLPTDGNAGEGDNGDEDGQDERPWRASEDVA